MGRQFKCKKMNNKKGDKAPAAPVSKSGPVHAFDSIAEEETDDFDVRLKKKMDRDRIFREYNSHSERDVNTAMNMVKPAKTPRLANTAYRISRFGIQRRTIKRRNRRARVSLRSPRPTVTIVKNCVNYSGTRWQSSVLTNSTRKCLN